MPVIPTLGWLRQEDLEFKASLGYIARLCQGKGREGKRKGRRKKRKGKEKRTKEPCGDIDLYAIQCV
jgi:hypothetical protein